ncbi:MAG: hypothetical protein BRC28_01600 [Nanohaloarchaea archaeon SW_4_43_9]|nr:MAG: hypothetical protein BRC28_01600 [Nanohaloarchaea archaeon SW_4_43_9]
MVPDGLRKVDEKFIGDDCDSLGPDYHKKSQAILDKDVEDNGFGTTKSTNINVYGGNGLIYAFRVRMQNVPIVKEGYTGPKKDFENGLCTEGKSSEIKDFLMDYSEDPYGNSKAARYVLCENATGYIQSNAGKIDNTGESNVDKFDFSGGYGTEIVFPKLLIRQNPDDCLNKGSESDFVDYRLNGDRCSTEEVLKGEEGSAPVTKNWNGLEVECGVKKETIIQNHNNGRFSFYNTGWFKTGGNLDGDIKGAEPLYEVENGEDGGEPPVAENAKGDLMVRFYDQSGARLTYDLRSYSVEEVDLNFETKGNMNVYLKQDEDNQIQLRIKRTDNEETGKADYEFKVLEDETTVYSKDKTVNLEEGNPFDVFVDLKYTDNKLEWTIEEGDGSEIVDETKEVSSIDVDYIKFRTSGDQNNRATKLNEVSIQE